MARFLLLIFAISCASGRLISFTDCGNGELYSVDVDPCSTDPCEGYPGDTIKFTVFGISNQNTEHATISATATVAGIPVPYPGIDPDVCKVVKCPLVKGSVYNGSMSVGVVRGVPPMTTTITVKMQGDNGQLGCAYATAILK